MLDIGSLAKQTSAIRIYSSWLSRVVGDLQTLRLPGPGLEKFVSHRPSVLRAIALHTVTVSMTLVAGISFLIQQLRVKNNKEYFSSWDGLY